MYVLQEDVNYRHTIFPFFPLFLPISNYSSLFFPIQPVHTFLIYNIRNIYFIFYGNRLLWHLKILCKTQKIYCNLFGKN